MVYKSGKIATLRRIYDVLEIDSEQVWTANASGLILQLPDIGDAMPDHLSNILNYLNQNNVKCLDIFSSDIYYHFICRDRLHSKQTPVMNGRLGEFELFFPELELVELEQIRIQIAAKRCK